LASELLPDEPQLPEVPLCEPAVPLWLPEVPLPAVPLSVPLVPAVPLVLEPEPLISLAEDELLDSVTFVRIYPLPLGSACRQPVRRTVSLLLLDCDPLIEPLWDPVDEPDCVPVVDCALPTITQLAAAATQSAVIVRFMVCVLLLVD